METKQEITVKEAHEIVINSVEYQNFCDGEGCPIKGPACREYCPTFTFRNKL